MFARDGARAGEREKRCKTWDQVDWSTMILPSLNDEFGCDEIKEQQPLEGGAPQRAAHSRHMSMIQLDHGKARGSFFEGIEGLRAGEEQQQQQQQQQQHGGKEALPIRLAGGAILPPDAVVPGRRASSFMLVGLEVDHAEGAGSMQPVDGLPEMIVEDVPMASRPKLRRSVTFTGDMPSVVPPGFRAQRRRSCLRVDTTPHPHLSTLSPMNSTASSDSGTSSESKCSADSGPETEEAEAASANAFVRKAFPRTIFDSAMCDSNSRSPRGHERAMSESSALFSAFHQQQASHAFGAVRDTRAAPHSPLSSASGSSMEEIPVPGSPMQSNVTRSPQHASHAPRSVPPGFGSPPGSPERQPSPTSPQTQQRQHKEGAPTPGSPTHEHPSPSPSPSQQHLLPPPPLPPQMMHHHFAGPYGAPEMPAEMPPVGFPMYCPPQPPGAYPMPYGSPEQVHHAMQQHMMMQWMHMQEQHQRLMALEQQRQMQLHQQPQHQRQAQRPQGAAPPHAGAGRSRRSRKTLSPLLQQHKSNGYRPTVRELQGCVAEFACDSHGSRLIQFLMENASDEDKNILVDEAVQAGLQLMQDTFGNYVMQNFLTHSTDAQRQRILNRMKGSVLHLSRQAHGCRVVQKALEVAPAAQCNWLIYEICTTEEMIVACARDPHATHCLQKAVTLLLGRASASASAAAAPGEAAAAETEEAARDQEQLLLKIESAVAANAVELAVHQHASRFVLLVMDDCNTQRSAPRARLLQAIEAHFEQLMWDQHGNFALQHLLDHGTPEQAAAVQAVVAQSVLHLAMHKFGSHLVEKCLAVASEDQVRRIVEQLLDRSGNNAKQLRQLKTKAPKHMPSDTDGSVLMSLMKDPYANFVVQRAFDASRGALRQELAREIQGRSRILSKFTYGRHILSHVGKAPGC